MLYDIVAERECCPTREFARGVTLGEAEALILKADYETADGYEGYDFVARPSGTSSPAYLFTDCWEPLSH